jgi:hypothetical protein
MAHLSMQHARFSFATTRVGVTGAAVSRKSLFTINSGVAVAPGDLFA